MYNIFKYIDFVLRFSFSEFIYLYVHYFLILKYHNKFDDVNSLKNVKISLSYPKFYKIFIGCYDCFIAWRIQTTIALNSIRDGNCPTIIETYL